MRFASPVVFALLALLAAPAFAKSEFVSRLDAACRAQGRTPPNPAELARATGVPYADCALCHTFSGNGFPSGSNDNADGAAYKRGNLDPFCIMAVVNRPPVLAPIGNQAVDVGQPLGLLLSASDLDGDPLVFSATNLPNGAVFMDGGSGMATFNWTPLQAGNYSVTFSVSDGVVGDAEAVVITVGSVNAPPVLAPIGAQSVLVGGTLTVPISATDPEGGMLAFTALGLPAEADLQDFGDGSAELVFMPSVAGVATVTVTATDAGAPPESTSETFTLTAQAPGAAEGPMIEFASWNLWESELTVQGGGAPPDSLVTIVEPGGGGALATGVASATGSFAITGRTFLAPCFVRARNADGVLGGQIGVMGSPQDCGTRLMTHAKPRWRCKDGMLSVRGNHAPVAADLSVVNAANGAMLMQAQSDRRGRFKLSVVTNTAPANIRLLLSSGSGNWTLGPVPVSGAEVICNRDDD